MNAHVEDASGSDIVIEHALGIVVNEELGLAAVGAHDQEIVTIHVLLIHPP